MFLAQVNAQYHTHRHGCFLCRCRTKGFCEILKNLGLDSSKVTFLISKSDSNLYQSSSNIHNVKVLNSLNVSSYDLINNDTLILDKETVNNFNKI